MRHVFSPHSGAVVLTFVLAAFAGAASAQAQQHMPPLLVFPTQNHPNEPDPLREACLNPGAWPTGWSRMSRFGNSVQYWAAWTNDAEVAQCFANLRAAGKELVIEAGVLKEPGNCTTAQACWNNAAPTLSRLATLDPPPLSLALDEPLTGSQSYASYAYVVDQTAEWIALARAQLPSTKMILHEAYPHHSAATLEAFFRDVHNAAIARTGWGLEYASIDHDWNAGSNFFDLVSMQDDVHAHGMGFMVVFWDASPSMDWYDGLMSQGEWYWSWRLFGLSPDLYAVLNWTGSPFTTQSETTHRSFTNSVRDFVLRFLPVASLPSNGYLYPGQSATSVDGRFSLFYQSDGNLVLYNTQTWAPLWASNTHGTSAGFTAMQGDGNLVIYDAASNPVWSSSTHGNPGAFLVVQSDGNLVIYADYYNSPLWASNTDCC